MEDYIQVRENMDVISSHARRSHRQGFLTGIEIKAVSPCILQAVTEFLGGPRDRETLKPLIEETTRNPRAEEYDLWVLVEKATGAVAGHCGLLEKEVERKREVELLYILAYPFWGKGYATEIGTCLIRYAFEENEASERVAAKLGMHFDKKVIRPGKEMRYVYAGERTNRQAGFPSPAYRPARDRPSQ